MRHRSFQDRVYDDGFWFSIFHPFVCPACNGAGGDWGYGDYPDDDCGFCKGRGMVGLWAKILTLNDWFLDGTIGNIKYARYRRTHQEKPPITNANNETPETSANNPHEHSDAWAFVAKLFVLLEDKWQGPLPDVVTMHIYAIQSAAHAEGVAEGAEQMKETIRKASEYRGMFGTYVVPAAYLGYPSVLAPTKEVAG